LNSKTSKKSNVFFRASAADFKKIPGSPIAYWANRAVFNLFLQVPSISEIASPRQGIKTGENERFLRLWFEVGLKNANIFSDGKTPSRWFACVKGGEYRKWYGNHEYFLNWENDGIEIKNFVTVHVVKV
jgi:hypothetical protein